MTATLAQLAREAAEFGDPSVALGRLLHLAGEAGHALDRVEARRLIAAARAKPARRPARNGSAAAAPAPSAEGDRIELVPYASIRPERVKWLWPGRIACGVLTLLVGQPGLGKTLLACWLAAALTRGRLGALAPLHVLYATAEDSPAHTLAPRLVAAGADMTRVHDVRLRRDGLEDGLTLPDDCAALAAAVRRVGAALVIIDPLLAHLNTTLDSHRDHSVRRALAPLHRLATDTGCAVLPVAHLNKAPSGDLFARVGGSIGLTGAVRGVLLMTLDPERGEQDTAARILTHGKSNLGPLAPALRLRVVGRHVETDDGPIQTAGIDLGAEAPHLRVSDVLAPADGEEQSARAGAEEWLGGALAEGRRPARELLAAARLDGVAQRTLERAKARLGVRVARDGFGAGGRVYWSLPIGRQSTLAAYAGEELADYGESLAGEGESDDTDSIGRHTQDVADNGEDLPPAAVFPEAV